MIGSYLLGLATLPVLGVILLIFLVLFGKGRTTEPCPFCRASAIPTRRRTHRWHINYLAYRARHTLIARLSHTHRLAWQFNMDAKVRRHPELREAFERHQGKFGLR